MPQYGIALSPGTPCKNKLRKVSIQTIEAPAYLGSGNVSREDVRAEWEALKDVHHFNAMLKRLAIHRCEALELVGEDYAKRVDIEKAEAALTLSQERQIPIMVFVGNRGHRTDSYRNHCEAASHRTMVQRARPWL